MTSINLIGAALPAAASALGQSSRDVEFYLLDHLAAAIFHPGELEFAGAWHLHEKGQERVGGDAWVQISLEHLGAGKAGGERIDDVARDHLAIRVLALTRLHDVRNQGLDFDQVTDLGGVGQLYARLVHVANPWG